LVERDLPSASVRMALDMTSPLSAASAVEGLALPQIDKAAKRKILGENYARLIGLDIEAAKQRVSNDEFAQRRAEGKAAPYSTTRSAGVAV
jgi:uncharacterized protein